MRGIEIYDLSKKREFLVNILEVIKSTYQLRTSKVLDLTEYGLLPDKYEHRKVNFIDFLTKGVEIKGKYDLLFVNTPWGVRLNQSLNGFEPKYRTNGEYLGIIKSLILLHDQGLGLYLLPPNVFFSKTGKEFLDDLERLGYSIVFTINLPGDLYAPITAIRPILVGLKKVVTENLFVAEVDYSSNFYDVVKNSVESELVERNLFNGYFIKLEHFSSFPNLKINEQIRILNTGYKHYKPYKISDLLVSINTTIGKFKDQENCILIPKVGNLSPTTDLGNSKLKHQNFFQIVLDKNRVIALYLEIYFRSKLGKLALASLKTFSFIPHINKSDLLELSIPIPSILIQKEILESYNSLNKLKNEVDIFESELSLNPQNANQIRDSIQNTLSVLGKLNYEDKIKELIRNGETQEIEFKTTFNIDIKTHKKEKYIQLAALKNVVAFLNTEGGSLLIGVDDNGAVCGIEEDDFQNSDKYLLNFKNAVKGHIGEGFYPLINWRLIEVDNRNVLFVDCRKSNKPCFLDEKDFYVRTNPSVDKLEGQKLFEYVGNHFKEK
jgi:hypothetical protein